jgi:hypothetical protein
MIGTTGIPAGMTCRHDRQALLAGTTGRHER